MITRTHLALPPLQHVVDGMGVGVVSEDYTDHIVGKKAQYRIRVMPWQSTELKTLLRTLDLLYMSTRFT